MLSRLALRTIGGEMLWARTAPMQIRACHHVDRSKQEANYKAALEALSKIKEGPERDLVNFPRKIRPLYPGKVRLGFIPEEWFQLFYKKTGVTGPYFFGVGLITYMLSKEIWVIEHDFVSVITLPTFVYILMKVIGPGLSKAMDKAADDEDESFRKYHQSSIEFNKKAIEHETKLQWRAEGQKYLIEAKRENVSLQLEAEYRKRLAVVHKEVKRRLDYQVEVLNAGRRIEQRHMVKWITDNVLKSISPQQEKEALQLCVANLKRLAAQPH